MSETATSNTVDTAQSERVVFHCSPILLDVVDRAANASFSSRSDFIRSAVVERLRREGVISQASAA
jgi:metal-responsive CopG/Arc/MetJ family transcriptional regulator